MWVIKVLLFHEKQMWKCKYAILKTEALIVRKQYFICFGNYGDIVNS